MNDEPSKKHYHTWHLGTCMNCGANQRTVLAEQKAAGLEAQRAKRARNRSLIQSLRCPTYRTDPRKPLKPKASHYPIPTTLSILLRASQNTPCSISCVSFPVNVFCWLG